MLNGAVAGDLGPALLEHLDRPVDALLVERGASRVVEAVSVGVALVS